MKTNMKNIIADLRHLTLGTRRHKLHAHAAADSSVKEPAEYDHSLIRIVDRIEDQCL